MEANNAGDKPNEGSQEQDNGIFNFMTPERATELYKRIHSNGPPGLEWKFYGRRKPGEPAEDSAPSTDETATKINETNNQDETVNTEFDFDEEFASAQAETTIANESLQFKTRHEAGSEKKTNLSDIMSDILRERQADNE